MKKLTLVLILLILALALTGVAAASPPEPGEFTITGTNDTYTYTTLPSGRTKFIAKASGDVIGYFTGDFTFEEKGNIDFDPGPPPAGSGDGTNQGTMTIETQDGQVVVRFGGQITGVVFQTGTFTVLRGTGSYTKLHGQGTYTGITDPFTQEFQVTFSGKFHTNRR